MKSHYNLFWYTWWYGGISLTNNLPADVLFAIRPYTNPNFKDPRFYNSQWNVFPLMHGLNWSTISWAPAVGISIQVYCTDSTNQMKHRFKIPPPPTFPSPKKFQPLPCSSVAAAVLRCVWWFLTVSKGELEFPGFLLSILINFLRETVGVSQICCEVYVKLLITGMGTT